MYLSLQDSDQSISGIILKVNSDRQQTTVHATHIESVYGKVAITIYAPKQVSLWTQNGYRRIGDCYGVLMLSITAIWDKRQLLVKDYKRKQAPSLQCVTF
eukprot:scaffold266066_cov19-Prasinocladus_malaysianus.AAC.2